MRERPVQLIIAGKAHPADEAGQGMISEWTHFIRQPAARPHAIFLSDYDMLLTEHLVQGVDVWINTPRRPWEASGTSGMKVLVNGGLNLSELDGWWAEAYSPEVGWALGDGQEHGDDPAWDAAEAEALYDLLERDVIPEFYSRDEHGYSRGLGGAHAEQHGGSNAPLFGRSRRPRIHRAALPPGCRSHSGTRWRREFRRAEDRRLAALRGKGVACIASSVRPRSRLPQDSTYLRSRSISETSIPPRYG